MVDYFLCAVSLVWEDGVILVVIVIGIVISGVGIIIELIFNEVVFNVEADGSFSMDIIFVFGGNILVFIVTDSLEFI